MATEAAKLALIVNDDIALRVLAAWACIDARLTQINDHEVIGHIATIANVDINIARKTLSQLKTIGCIRDGDISELADRLLQQRVAKSVGVRKKQ